MEQVNVALLGLGTVGTGVWKMVSTNQDLIARRTGKFFDIKGILIRNLQKKRDLPGIENILTSRFDDLFADQPIDVVIEAMGGVEPALTYVKEAITRGCHIVTANKELVARHGVSLHRLAKKHGVQILFEASVGGGIPALGTLQHFLKVNRIHQVLGIINGTTNYILTQMEQDKRDFADVLREAQEKGYAEADPAADVEGLDAVHKLAILIRIVFGIHVSVDDIFVQGITDVTLTELELAQSLGYTVKLISQAKQYGEEGPVAASVRPMLLPNQHPLSQIQGIYNSLYIEGDQVQDLTLIGQGAGEKPTASAVVEDLTNLYRMDAVYHDYPSKPLLPTEETTVGTQFVCFTAPSVTTQTAQQQLIKQVSESITGKVKNWVCQTKADVTTFALIVEADEQLDNKQLTVKTKLTDIKVRPVLTYGVSQEEKELEVANCS